MRFSKNLPKEKSFFTKKKILSTNQALFFILEEATLIFLIVIQLYHLLGIELVNNSFLLFQYPIEAQNILWFAGSIAFFFIGYFVIVLRDETVNLIHHNFTRALFNSAKQKIENTDRQVAMFVFGELAFATIIALSIFLYLDPEININYPDGTPIPFFFKVITFVLFLGISLLLFSHTKQFREVVYGIPPVQKRLHGGEEELKRITNSKTGSIRVASRKHYLKRK